MEGWWPTSRTVWPLAVVLVVACGVILGPGVANAYESSGRGYEYEEPALAENYDDNGGDGSPDSSAAVTVRQQEAIPAGTEVNNDESRTGDSEQPLDAEPTWPHPAHDNGTMMPLTTLSSEDGLSCSGREKLPIQPTFVSREVSVIRKCCPRGESLSIEHTKYVSCQKNNLSVTMPRAIKAQFYRDCIEDLEEEVALAVKYGSPCPIEGNLVGFGARMNDTLYVIQNGSLLVIYDQMVEYDVYDAYCLDHDRTDGSLIGYVCPSQVRVMADVVKGQLFMFAVTLALAVPGLLVTAALYMTIPNLHNLHGRALAMNCVNFAVALLLECWFQFRNGGKRMLVEDMVLENYAEYFILATFFWLLVNCGNHCFHACYSVPRGAKFDKKEENVRFALYAVVAQLIPLLIIISYSTTPSGLPAFKHYLFIPIGVTLVLGLVCLITTGANLSNLKKCFYDRETIRTRLLCAGKQEELKEYPPIRKGKINKVIYMFKYTVPLFCVMAFVWTIMAVTYYATHELPIFYDILFAFQGILMFVVFVCMPRPWHTIRSWFTSNNYCTSVFRPPAVNESECKKVQVGVSAGVPVALSRSVSYNAPPLLPCETTVSKKRSLNPFTYLEDD
uniref:Methuselah N-terminal domain-containing protein n=1 Tax=Anopheles farauti TaxID=69004 RepID=A0A182Q4X1_9DIPT